MKFQFKHILSASAISLLLCPGLSAQTINEEVTVRHDDVLTLPDVSRPAVYPRLMVDNPKAAQMPFALRPVKVTVPGLISTLEPVPYADSIATSTYRGYVAAGFMPSFNLAAAAGYKFIDTDHTRFNAWTQYDGTSYRGTVPMAEAAERHSINRNTLSLGGALHQAVARESFIDAALDYTMDRFNTAATSHRLLDQSVNRINAQATWTIANSALAGGIGLTYGHFGYGKALATDPESASPLKAPSENRLAIDADFAGNLSASSSVGVAASFSLIGNANSAVRSHSLLRLKPHYKLERNRLSIEAALLLDFSFRAGKAFHVAPDVKLTWTPSHRVALYLKAGGGVVQNTLASMFDFTPYTIPAAYSNSNVPLTAEIGATLGRWAGFYADVALTYADANSWLMPSVDPAGMNIFEHVDLNAFKMKLGLGYNYRNIVDIYMSAEKAPHKYSHAYYLWRDRAETVIDARILVRPIEQLDLSASWHWRGGRRTMSADGSSSPLGNVATLGIGADYRLNDRWCLMLCGENLLNRHYLLPGNMPSQGITGMLGASYKF